MQILVVSSHTNPKSVAPINHKVYCDKHGYRYLFDGTPYALKSVHDQKLYAIYNNLESCDWLVWMDDDAFFMDFSTRLENFIPDRPDVDFVICNSPKNSDGEWTAINSGVIFVRNNSRVKSVIRDIIETDLGTVKSWWNPQKYGRFSNGDQDKFLFVFVSRNMIGESVEVVDYTQFNARPQHFEKDLRKYFICHFPGKVSKRVAIGQVSSKHNLNAHLLTGEKGDLHDFRYSMFHHSHRPLTPNPPANGRLRLIKWFVKRFFGLI